MLNRNLTLEQLLATRHPELPLFLLQMRNTERFEGFATDPGKQLFREHLLYWWDLEEKGQLVAAGPVDVGSPAQEGLAILIAKDVAAAEVLAAAEPLHAAGWRINTVRRWQLNEGMAVAVTKTWLAARPDRS